MTFKLGTKYEDFKAPWEKAGEEIDEEKVKRLLFNALEAEATATEKVKTTAAEKVETDKALKAYKDAEADAAREKETVEERHTREKKELEDKLAKAEAGGGRETLLLEVALEKGLTKAQAKRLQGNTKEELEADADDYLKDVKPAGDPDDETEPPEEVISLERQPKIVKTSQTGKPREVDIKQSRADARKVSSLIA